MDIVDEIRSARDFPGVNREPMMAGLPARVFFVLAMLLFATVTMHGITIVSVTLAIAVYILLLPPLRSVFEREPLTFDFLGGLIGFRQRYTRHGEARGAEGPSFFLKSRP